MQNYSNWVYRILLAASLTVALSATAAEPQASLVNSSPAAKFSDIRPTDRAFQALQSISERYGCITGFPNQTESRNFVLTRYQFAAALDACRTRVD